MTEGSAQQPDQQPPKLSMDDLDAEYADPYEGMEFSSYDPAGAAEIPQGTPLGGGKDTENQTGTFDERHKDDFEGLAFLGALEARFDYIGHRFHIRTLTVDEALAVARIVKDFEGTIGDTKAYATAMVALSVVSVDGLGLPIPHEEASVDYGWAYQRFDYVKAKWYPFTIDYVYERILLLEDRVRNVLTEMTEQAKKVRSRAGSTPG